MYLKVHRWLLLLVLVNCLSEISFSQISTLNFRHLTTSQGLSDGGIRCITQDKYGYIWLGTYNGLNRFNSYSVKVFQHSSASNSLPDNIVTSLFSDQKGNLWVGFKKGLYQYDFKTNNFLLVHGSENISIQKVIQVNADALCLLTNLGVSRFDIPTFKFSFLKDLITGNNPLLRNNSIRSFCVNTEGDVYLSTDRSVIHYNPVNATAIEIPLPLIKDSSLNKIAIDRKGNLWASFGESSVKLIRIDKSLSDYKVYSTFSFSKGKISDNSISDVFVDNSNRVWFSSTRSGIALYDSTNDKFINFEHDPLQPMSLVYNNLNNIFQDKDGNIWVGSEGYGASYFNPDKNLFHTILPSYNQSPTLPDLWCRAVSEDKAGNLWIGTANGLAFFDRVKSSYTIFKNEDGKERRLFSNSIRSVLCDDDLVWIGTSQGLNRYHISSGRMDFIGAEMLLPGSFFWSLLKDHNGSIWAGTRNGLYKMSTGKFDDLSSDSLFSKYRNNNIRALFEDKKHRLWMGCFSNGVLMYDPSSQKMREWKKGDDSISITNNSITSFAEDKEGIIWVSTSDGLNSIDQNFLVHRYITENGLHSSRVSALLADQENRIWMGSANSLMMLDQTRKRFKDFGLEDGLGSIEFNDQSGIKLRDGRMVLPALKGLLVFNPSDYEIQQKPFKVYLSGLNISNKPFETGKNLEELDTLNLSYDQSFFTLELSALNYTNPQQMWYGYRLEPFDKKWIYTRERIINYTNVPGGHYIFHYKTTADRDNWNVPEKMIDIRVGTIFYKTWWFAIILTLLLGALLYWLYKLRVRQQENIHSLKIKTQLLEKEKALVMYESLKQQLNPHFLFNTLSSLSSLILADPKSAREFLDQMSKIYRYILKSRDTELVPLVEEIKFVEVYIKLQQTRFTDGLRVNIHIDEECYHLKIVPVTLQNLVENAIKHNITDKEQPLIIDLFDEDGYLVVRNSSQPKSHVETSNKQGLNNMRSLYHYLTSKPFEVTRNEHYFTVKIPLI